MLVAASRHVSLLLSLFEGGQDPVREKSATPYKLSCAALSQYRWNLSVTVFVLKIGFEDIHFLRYASCRTNDRVKGLNATRWRRYQRFDRCLFQYPLQASRLFAGSYVFAFRVRSQGHLLMHGQLAGISVETVSSYPNIRDISALNELACLNQYR
ncbi:hypothetical protein RRG08_045407 [Elysia crispata]|uniref:Uncharacterized protein n=1 Tax=Elysia crispata TaxID=231223 RepID=A0AAE1CIY7_9GAST|nr:hypothetical protein RRG08_045407 [Elysia crispata]